MFFIYLRHLCVGLIFLKRAIPLTQVMPIYGSCCLLLQPLALTALESRIMDERGKEAEAIAISKAQKVPTLSRSEPNRGIDRWQRKNDSDATKCRGYLSHGVGWDLYGRCQWRTGIPASWAADQ